MKHFILVILLLFIIGCSRTPHIPIFTGDCITNSVVAVDALRKQGFDSFLRVGGQKLESGEYIFHCWAEYKDKKTGEWIEVRTDICRQNDPNVIKQLQ